MRATLATVSPATETRITLVPHTHWDREWYAPFDEFLERLVAMMDTLIELGDRGFPHFHLDGQIAMVDDYLAVRPEREADVRRLAAEGRLSLGPWFTQMDEFLTSGESHVRNLERGLARARELGPPLEAGYMPDQFGHIGQMPQILRMGGIDRAVVWRGVPASVDRTAFRWRSPDGSEVLTEYMAFGYFNGEPYRRASSAAELAAAMRSSVEQLRPYLASDRMLVMVGADHSGPDATLPERVSAASAHAVGIHTEIAGLATHLDGRVVGELPVWQGELRSSARAHLLPNVYSARVHQKRERGRVEALVERYAEPLAALAPLTPHPREQLDRVWQLLLWNGAHDSACGCSHDGVARDVDARFAEARSICETINDEAIGVLARSMGGPGTLRFNPSPFERDDVPGLGIAIDGGRRPLDPRPVELRVDAGWVVADGIAFAFREEPDVGDLYNFCPETPEQRPTAPNRIDVVHEGLEATWPGLAVRLRITRRDDEPFLRLEGEIDNERPDHRLRLHVRLDEAATGSLAGSPFELVERPLVSEGSELESASPTWPARYVVQAGGVAAYHEGVFEYEVTGAELAITLLRAVGTISRQHLATRPYAAGPGVATPLAQMIGSTPFALGLRAAAGRLDLLRDWERFALPLLDIDVPAAAQARPQTSRSLLDVRGEAVLSNIRVALGGGVEVRAWNPFVDRPVRWSVAGSDGELGPAKIATIELDPSRVPRFGGARDPAMPER